MALSWEGFGEVCVNCFIRQPVLVARRTPSGTGPTRGAATTVVVLRRGWVETFRRRGRGA